MKREPLVTVSFILAAVASVLVLLKSFGVDLTADQQAAISGFASVVAPLLVAVLVRPKVTPVADPDLDALDHGYSLPELLVGLVVLLVAVILLLELIQRI